MGPAAGGVAGVGHAAAAAGMAQRGPLATLDALLQAYLDYNALANDAARVAFLRERVGFKPTQAETFKEGPGDPLDALVMSSAPAGTTLSQMTMPPPRPLHPPLIVGGLPPPGYIFVGRHHHGGPIYGSADTVHASMMHSPADAAAPGHAADQ